MINLLTTLLKPTSGTAKVCGYDIVKGAAEVSAPSVLSTKNIPPMMTLPGWIIFFSSHHYMAYLAA